MAVPILEMPFFYAAELVRRGCRNPGRVDFIDTAPVRVREIAVAAAPVVARCAHVSRIRYGVGGAEESVERTVDYRLVDGALLRRVDLPGANYGLYDDVPAVGDVQRATAEWAASLARHRSPLLAHPLIPEPDYRAALYQRDAVPVRRWIGDDRAAQLDRLRHAAAQAAVIDGALYAASRGPAWQIEMAHHLYGRPSQVALFARPELGHLVGETAVGPEGLDALRLAARRLAQAHNCPFAGEVGRVDALGGPGLLARVDDPERALRSAVVQLMAAAAPVALALEPQAIRAYADLKEMLALPPGGGDLGFETLLMTARELNDRWCRHTGGDPAALDNPLARFLERQATAQAAALAAHPDLDPDRLVPPGGPGPR